MQREARRDPNKLDELQLQQWQELLALHAQQLAGLERLEARLTQRAPGAMAAAPPAHQPEGPVEPALPTVPEGR